MKKKVFKKRFNRLMKDTNVWLLDYKDESRKVYIATRPLSGKSIRRLLGCGMYKYLENVLPNSRKEVNIMIINKNTKKAEYLISNYKRATESRLCELYESCSDAKQSAYLYCYNKYLATSSRHRFRVYSANTFSFVAGWCGDYVNPETGELFEKTIYVETSCNSYIVHGALKGD